MVQSIGTKYVVYQKKGYLSHISYVCLVSAVYNPSLQLQRLDHFVVVLWLVMHYKLGLKH